MQGIGGDRFWKVVGTSKLAKGEQVKALTDLEKDKGEAVIQPNTLGRTEGGTGSLPEQEYQKKVLLNSINPSTIEIGVEI